MFTGIISSVGTVIDLEDGKILKARILCPYDYQTIVEGGSIAHDGICLTIINKVREKMGTSYEVEISSETLSKTNIKNKESGWIVGREINLEKSLRLGDELGGHIVTGHIDGVAELISSENVDKSTKLTFHAPDNLKNLIAPKGSIALNGTSLTVNEIDDTVFTVNIIPHTHEVTNWKNCQLGHVFNLEIDVMARYIARLCEHRNINATL